MNSAFVKTVTKAKQYNVLHKMNNMCRYIDDIGIANCSNFLEMAANIYPSYLTLNKANVSSVVNSPFLDLSISVQNSKFMVKVYNKTDDYSFTVISFPFLDSNLSTNVCYSVYFGEVLRYLRICSCLEDFVIRTRMFSAMLITRGYSKASLSRQLSKVLFRYLDLTIKFDSRRTVSDIIKEVLS